MSAGERLGGRRAAWRPRVRPGLEDPATSGSRSFGRLYALIASLVIGLGGFLGVDLYRSQQTSRASYVDAVRGLELIGEIQYQTQEARRTLLYALATTDSNRQVEYADLSRTAEAQVAELLRGHPSAAHSRTLLQAAQELRRDWTAYLKVRDELISSMLEGDPKAAVERDLREGVPAFNEVRDDLLGLKQQFKADAEELLRQVDTSFERSVFRLVVTLTLALIAALIALSMLKKNEVLRVVQRGKQQFEDLVNTIDGVVWEADPHTFQFTFVSRQAQRLLGYPPQQWLDETSFWADHIHPDDREAAMQSCRQAVAQHRPCALEHRMIAADRRAVWVRNNTSLVLDGDRVILLRGILLDLTEKRKAEEELAALNKQLVDTSRQAGMAEVATGVLHNVGNVLNSINVSATLVTDQVRGSKISSLTRLSALLQEHAPHLSEFVTAHPQGQQLPAFLAKLTERLVAEQTLLRQEMESLRNNLDHVKDIVAMQQSYSKVCGVLETLPLVALVEDALRINAVALTRHQIQVTRQFADVPPVCVDKHKVLQILVNLIRNAKYALDDRDHPDKRLTLSISVTENQRVLISVTDNGVGIPRENLTRIFGHGFTTRKDGHGYGLHSGALVAAEMGGSLSAHSEGLGCGATFTLELPLTPQGQALQAA